MRSTITAIILILCLSLNAGTLYAQEQTPSCETSLEICQKNYDDDSKRILYLTDKYLKKQAENKALQARLKEAESNKDRGKVALYVVIGAAGAMIISAFFVGYTVGK